MSDEWLTAQRGIIGVRRLEQLCAQLAAGAPTEEEQYSWRATGDALRALLHLHRRGCPLATDDPRASVLATRVLLDPMGVPDAD